LIARAATRYLAGAGRAVARELVLEARRRQAGGRRAEPEPVPASRLASAAYAAWWCGVVAFVLVILNVDLLLPDGPRAGLRIALGVVLLPSGVALAFDRERVRPLLLSRFAGRGRRILVGAGLRLLGVVWIGAGAFELLRGVRDLT
jgi:hypothetical protein